MRNVNTDMVMKSAEVDGFRVELVSENRGMTFRVNIEDSERSPRTRVFTDYQEASALFNSYLQGN